MSNVINRLNSIIKNLQEMEVETENILSDIESCVLSECEKEIIIEKSEEIYNLVNNLNAYFC